MHRQSAHLMPGERRNPPHNAVEVVKSIKTGTVQLQNTTQVTAAAAAQVKHSQLGQHGDSTIKSLCSTLSSLPSAPVRSFSIDILHIAHCTYTRALICVQWTDTVVVGVFRARSVVVHNLRQQVRRRRAALLGLVIGQLISRALRQNAQRCRRRCGFE